MSETGTKTKFTYCSQIPVAQHNWFCQKPQANWQFPAGRSLLLSLDFSGGLHITDPELLLPCQWGMRGNQRSARSLRVVVWNLSKGLPRTSPSYAVWPGINSLDKAKVVATCTADAHLQLIAPGGSLWLMTAPVPLADTSCSYTVVASAGCCPFHLAGRSSATKDCCRPECAILVDKICLNAVLESLRSPGLYSSQH